MDTNTSSTVSFQSPGTVQPPVGFKKKRSIGKTILGVLLALILFGAVAYAVFATLQWQDVDKRLTAEKDNVSKLTAVSTQLSKEKKELEEEMAEAQTTAAQATTQPTAGDEALVTKTAKAYSEVILPQGAQLVPKVNKVKDGFASVTLPHSVGPIPLTMKKAPNGEWVVLTHTKPTQDEINTYKIPTEFQ